MRRASLAPLPLPWALLPLLVVSATGNAYTWESDYGASITLGYDDNFRLTPDDELETLSTDLGLSADIEGATEISSISLIIGASAIDYSEAEIEDRTNYRALFDWSGAGERTSGDLAVSFVQESTTETELLDTGLNQDGTRNTTRLAPGLDHRLDERNTLTAGLNYRDVRYRSVDFTEYTETSATASWRHALQQTDTAFVSYRISEYDPDSDSGSTRWNTILIGFETEPSERTIYSFAAGYSDVDRPQGSETGGNYAIDILHSADERNSFVFSVGSDYKSSGGGEVRKEDRFYLRWNRGLSETASFILSSEALSTDRRDYLIISARLNRQVSREVLLSGSIRYRQREENLAEADSTSLFVSVSYQPV